MNKKNIIICAIVGVLIGSGAFYGGMQYEVNKTKAIRTVNRGNFNSDTSDNGAQRGQQGGQNRGQRAGDGAGFINGDIISKDDTNITVKALDGNSRIIFFSDATIIGKTVSGSISDLNSGGQVIINGKANSDGSITAQNIQIRSVSENSATE
jgi:hypothetical protein